MGGVRMRSRPLGCMRVDLARPFAERKANDASASCGAGAVQNPNSPRRTTPLMTPGSIVRCRNRDWVLLPSDDDNLLSLRPLTGATDDVVAVHKGLAKLVGM